MAVRNKLILLIIICGWSMGVIIAFSYFDIYRSLFHLHGNIKIFEIDKAIDGKCIESHQNAKSDWFQQRYSRSVMPFWTQDNLEISEGPKKWWLRLQFSKETDMAALMKKLYNAGMPTSFEKFSDTRNNQCITCAVVGNSANLKHSKCGQDIDRHDTVIRFNKAPTAGFEDDVGNKTTYRLLYPESAVHLPMDTSLVLAPFKPRDVEWLFSTITTGYIKKTYRTVLDKIHCNVSKIKILHPEFLRYTHKNWLNEHGRYPSTGAIGIALSLQLCDKVDVYGFGANAEGEWQHYWEHLQPQLSRVKQAGDHDTDAEKEFLQKLQREEIIKLHT